MAGRSENARRWILDALREANRPLYSIEILSAIEEKRKHRRNNLSIRQVGSLCAAMQEVAKLKQEPHGCLWTLRYGRRVYNNNSGEKEHESEEE